MSNTEVIVLSAFLVIYGWLTFLNFKVATIEERLESLEKRE